DIERGRQVWQSIGGQQLGSIWGHGAYVAPDWGADWMHREAQAILDGWAAREHGIDGYRNLDAATQAAYAARVQALMRPNTWDEGTATITLDAERVAAIREVATHYVSLFGNEADTAALREAYAMRNNTVAEPAHREALTAFFWWAAWSQVTERPGQDISYTANWPADKLVGNTPPPSAFLWTVFSVLFLIAGVALLAGIRITPSMRATAKYFWVVMALFLVQILLGATTAHYQVEGQEAYGFALSEILPYSLTRTWHTQLAVLWIATAWLGMGLYIG